MIVFEELDAFQYLVAFPAQSGQFTDKDDVDVVVQAKGKGLLKERPVFVGFST